METKVKSELEAIIAGRNLPEGHHYQSLGDIVYAVRNYGEQLDAGDREFFDALLVGEYLASEDSFSRSLAYQVCGELQIERAKPILLERLIEGKDENLGNIIQALGLLQASESIPYLKRHIGSDNCSRDALVALAEINFVESIPYIKRVLDGEFNFRLKSISYIKQVLAGEFDFRLKQVITYIFYRRIKKGSLKSLTDDVKAFSDLDFEGTERLSQCVDAAKIDYEMGMNNVNNSVR